MKIYVASSWRNAYQQSLVQTLRVWGHDVYDFREEGFSWDKIDLDWRTWSSNVSNYLDSLYHPLAIEGFNKDMEALEWCEVCIYVMPCGVSASLEVGWACGKGKKVIFYIPELREPDLMIKMGDLITTSLKDIKEYLGKEEI